MLACIYRDSMKRNLNLAEGKCILASTHFWSFTGRIYLQRYELTTRNSNLSYRPSVPQQQSEHQSEKHLPVFYPRHMFCINRQSEFIMKGK